ncbi:MAG: hypothetical protein J0L51_02555 [Rhizobiales bacterium]|nr:hypothetical protein [Hyphomicrobiales bacterium]
MSNLIDWKTIENHIGWGRPDAPVVFIGMEEGYSGKEKEIEKHKAELEAHLIERSMYPEISEIDFSKANRVIRTYRAPCHFMLRREFMVNQKPFEAPKNLDLLEYQKTFGMSTGDVFLLELFPYPARATTVWPYSDPPFFRDNDRASYIKRLLEPRSKLLMNAINLVHREAIICYGKAYQKYYKGIFPENLSWKDEFSFQYTEWNRQKIAIVPHFSSRVFNSISKADDLFELIYG